MVKSAALILIDTNQYLDFYRMTQGKRLLDTLRELQDYIFVTIQIVEEVQRNKLQVQAAAMNDHLKRLEIRRVDVPDYLFNISRDTATKLRKKLNDINQRIEALKPELVNSALQTLQRIRLSEDEVSQALVVLFDRAIRHAPEELQRARDRRDRGNPPGKPGKPLGDQLTWEQLLNHLKGKSKLWIISRDSDYHTAFQHAGSAGKLFLNPLLYQDLKRVNQSPLKVCCFDSLAEGLSDFVRTTGVAAKKLPPPDQLQEIKKEQDSLPPVDWMSSMDAANMAAIWNTQRQRQAAALFATTTFQAWPPGEGMVLPVGATSTKLDLDGPGST